MINRPLYDDRAKNAFQQECRSDKNLRRLRLIKSLIIMALFGSLFGLSGSMLWGGSSVVLELLTIWFLNSQIARKKRSIKDQYLTL